MWGYLDYAARAIFGKLWPMIASRLTAVGLRRGSGHLGTQAG
jgi:hypothetical protein